MSLKDLAGGAGRFRRHSAQFLYYELDTVSLGRSGSEQIAGSWLAGQTGPATGFLEHERQAYPELCVKLTLDRNRGWVPRFESMGFEVGIAAL